MSGRLDNGVLDVASDLIISTWSTDPPRGQGRAVERADRREGLDQLGRSLVISFHRPAERDHRRQGEAVRDPQEGPQRRLLAGHDGREVAPVPEVPGRQQDVVGERVGRPAGRDRDPVEPAVDGRAFSRSSRITMRTGAVAMCGCGVSSGT